MCLNVKGVQYGDTSCCLLSGSSSARVHDCHLLAVGSPTVARIQWVLQWVLPLLPGFSGLSHCRPDSAGSDTLGTGQLFFQQILSGW